MFRWHLGTGDGVTISGQGRTLTVRWADADMKLEADQPLKVSQYKAPDATVKPAEDNQHTCLQVQTGSPTAAVRLTTTVTPVGGVGTSK